MVITPVLWSTAGIVTRQLTPELQQSGRFEITFWRSLFAAVWVGGYLVGVQHSLLGTVRRAGRAGLVSGAMWCVMFCAFMLALTLTTVANTLIVLSVGPLTTALLARAWLRQPIAPRTWLAIAIAMAGMVWMFAGSFRTDGGAHVAGMLLAFAVPIAGAVNLVTIQKSGGTVDLIPAVFLGGVFSVALMIVPAWPLHAGGRDIFLLALLGFFQLGLPCTLMLVAARNLSATEISLLALLEVVLGPLWAWLGAGEVPARETLAGGALVLVALIGNELLPGNRPRTIGGRRSDSAAAIH